MMEALTWKGKIESYAKIKDVKKAAVAEVPEDQPEKKAQVKRAISELVELMTRETILRDRKRLDGRAFEEVRPIEVEIGVLPRTHGSALFTRGETQALVTVTLGTSDDTQLIEDLEGEFERKFLLHYNFPPFSVGEVKRFGSPGRREIGHGRLAWRSIDAVLPEGVPVHDPRRVGHPRVERLLVDGDDLRRLARPHGRGRPDERGRRGSRDGPRQGRRRLGRPDRHRRPGRPLRRHGLQGRRARARASRPSRWTSRSRASTARSSRRPSSRRSRGRMHILDIMEKAIPSARPEISAYAPRLLTIHVPEEKIRDVIGSGGKTIRALQKEYTVKIDVQDDGSVTVASVDMASAEKCIEAIKALTTVPEIGTEYDGTVKRVEPYGAFVEILPGLDGLVHISELAPGRVRETTDVVKLGDKAKVKIIAIDPVNGKIKLSRRQALTPEEAAAEVERLGLNASPAPEGEGGDDRPPFRREGGFGHRDSGRAAPGATAAASAARAARGATAPAASAARAH